MGWRVRNEDRRELKMRGSSQKNVGFEKSDGKKLMTQIDA